MYSGEYDACDVTLSVYTLRVTSQASYSPEYIGVMYSGEYDACDVTLSVYTILRVTSQASYSPEYITPTQKKSYNIVV
jgi:hypothetical protein